MHRGAVARRSHVHLAGIGLRIGDELGDRLRLHVLGDRHHIRHAIECRDRRDVANEVELQIGVKRGVDVVRGIDQQHRVAVRFRIDHRLGGDVVAGAGLVFDDELLAEPLRQPLADQARDDVGGAAGRIADHPAHRPRRIVQPRTRRRSKQKPKVRSRSEQSRCDVTSCSFSLGGRVVSRSVCVELTAARVVTNKSGPGQCGTRARPATKG